MLDTPSCFAIWARFPGLLSYCRVEVREITFNALIFASRVRISSWMPFAKKALSGSRLRFSNGNTAMLFPGTADTTADVLGFCRCQKRKLPTASAAISTHKASVRPRLRDAGRAAETGIGSIFSEDFARRFGLSE